MTNYPAAPSNPNRFPDVPAAIWRLRVGIGVVRLVPRLRHRVVELLRVETRIVEGVPPAPVRQGQLGGHPDVLLADGLGAAPRGVRDRGARHHQIGAHPVDVERRAQRRDAP